MTKDKLDLLIHQIEATLYPKCLSSNSKVKDLQIDVLDKGLNIRYVYKEEK